MVQPVRNRRKQLKSKPLAGVAEVCETRSLLCATVFNTAVDVTDVPTGDVADDTAIQASDEESVISKDGADSELTDVTPDDAGIVVCRYFMADFVSDPTDTTDSVDASLVDTVSTDDVVFKTDDVPVPDDTIYTDYDFATLPSDWDPSWAYRSFSVQSSEEVPVDGSVDAAVIDSALDGEPIDLEVLSSVDFPWQDDSLTELPLPGDTLNQDDLIATCFAAMPSDDVFIDVKPDMPIDGSEESVDPTLTDSEDTFPVDPNVIYTMVLRGHSVDTDSVDAVSDETGEVVETEETGDGSELWQTFFPGADGNDSEDPIVLAYSSMPGTAVSPEDSMEGDDSVTLEDNDSTTDVSGETVDLTGVVIEDFAAPDTSDSGDPVTDVSFEFDPILMNMAPAGVPEESGDPSADPVTNIAAQTTSSGVFSSSPDQSGSVGTLLARNDSETRGGWNNAPKPIPVAFNRGTSRLRSSGALRSVPTPGLNHFGNTLGTTAHSDDESPEQDVNADSTAPDSTSDATESTTSQVNGQDATQVAYQSRRDVSIDLFMSRFHHETFTT